MAFKLKQDERAELQAAVVLLEEKRAAVIDAFEKANALIEEIRQAVDPLITEYNEAMQEAQLLVTDVRERFQEEYDEKSDKWKESKKAEAAEAMINAWDNFEMEPMGDVEIDDLDVELDEYHTALEEMMGDPD